MDKETEIFSDTHGEERKSGDAARIADSAGAAMREQLAVIAMAANYILPAAESLGDERAKKYSAMLRRGLYKLRRLGESLEAFADDRELTEDRAFDLAALLRDTAEAAEEWLERKVDVMIEPRELPFRGERALIRRAVLTLIGNCVKYAGEDARIIVSLSAQDGKVLISVADNGAGIDGGGGESVWAKYRETRAYTDTDETRGTGFGLSLVMSAAARHGGSAAIKSSRGGGTVVVMTLPIRGTDDAVRSPVAEYNAERDALVTLADVMELEKFYGEYHT